MDALTQADKDHEADFHMVQGALATLKGGIAAEACRHEDCAQEQEQDDDKIRRSVESAAAMVD